MLTLLPGSREEKANKFLTLGANPLWKALR